MTPDDFKQAWQAEASNTRVNFDADLLLTEVRRNEQAFRAMIFFRDLREVVIGVIMVPVWIVLGLQLKLPWTWWLTLPAVAWIVGFILVDRMRHKRPPSESGEPLRQRVEISLDDVEHQIWLLRNVLWWYILPPSVTIYAFFCDVAWRVRAQGWEAVAFFAFLTAFLAGVMGGLYWVNQVAVRTYLAPRRDELKALLASFDDETSAAN